MGFACTFLLGRAGEPIRPVLIAQKDSLSIPGMFGVYVLERVFDMAATVLLARLRTAVISSSADSPVPNDANLMSVARSAGVALLVVLLVAVAFLIYFRYHGGAWLAPKIAAPEMAHGLAREDRRAARRFQRRFAGHSHVGRSGRAPGYTAVHWMLVVLDLPVDCARVRRRLASLSFTGAVLVLAFTLVGSAVQLPGVGGGVAGSPLSLS